MPPKPRFTREEIVQVALALVCEEGVENLTARELAEWLGSSPQPIFTVFEDMNELRGAVSEAAGQRLASFVNESAGYTHAFKQTSMQIIKFAMYEPKLFQLLLMSEIDEPMSFEKMLETRGGRPDAFVEFVSDHYDLTADEAKSLFKHTWLYTYGIAVLCATKMCTFTEEELMQLIGADFMSMLNYIKEGHLNDQTPVPEHIGPVGTAGKTGAIGNTEAIGAARATGTTGTPGAIGTARTTGAAGTPGAAGATGADAPARTA